MSKYIEFNPIGRMAPCQTDGEVTTIDNDNKQAVCYCSANPQGCGVNGRNIVIDILIAEKIKTNGNARQSG